jgi:hypothetical protein
VGILFLRFGIEAAAESKSRATLLNDPNANLDRIQRADVDRERKSPLPRYIVSAVGFLTAGAVLAHILAPAVAYAIVCLALVGRCVADQIAEERAPRRRTAVIGRSRAVDPTLVTWIALTAASTLALIPWLVDHTYRIAAILVAICVLTMVAVAWRVASAPPLLFGNDLEAEQVVDRETRALRTGNSCILTVATVLAFVAFLGGFVVNHYEGAALAAVCVALFAWKAIYARRASRAPLAS